MAAVPAIHHKVDGATTLAASGGGQLLAVGRSIPTGAMQVLRVRALVWQTSSSKVSYLDFVILAKNVGGTVTVVTLTVANSDGRLANTTATAPSNAMSDMRMEEDDALLAIEGSVSGTQIRVEANQANASSRIWNWEIDETTVTPA